MKKCNKCLEDKPEDDFYTSRISKRTNKPILFASCKLCSNGLSKNRYKNLSKDKKQALFDRNKTKYGKRIRKNWALQTKFGITIDDFEKMIIEQNSKCYICSSEIKGREIKVDHCHRTGKIRKLLCHKCNTGISFFNEDIKLFMKCIEYVKEHDYI